MVLCICGHHWKNHTKEKWRDFNVPCTVMIEGGSRMCNCWTFEYPDPENPGEVLETSYYTSRKNGRTKLRPLDKCFKTKTNQ